MPAPARNPGGPVAVGYDGSEPSQLAVRWAAGHAAATNRTLKIVHAWVWPVFTKNLGPVKGVEGSGLRHAAEATLQEGLDLARSVTAGLKATVVIDGVIEPGLPAQVLRFAAEGAGVLAVGHRGMGRFLGQLVGSACLDLAVHSPCPLMVVRYPGRPGQPIAAGIDEKPRHTKVVAEAARMAAGLNVPLQLIHVAGDEHQAQHGRHAPLHGKELLDQAVELARSLAPDVPVEGILLESHPVAKDLLAAAAQADVLVLGAHHREGHPGSTVSSALERALCNVLITR
ncbi:nucleotide-binding universal stress UspA family protein [Arthrobacter sp. PvP102]|jgi:nucleotide-binding universal stress UspA family protein|uniref:universal stress protein n=1 Tax=unclassified Arthrobacter TaxID=235627 RepID=UPI001AE535AC|nr:MULTISPECIES: universal stress protein [unclassified Arthrobacter]MBP1233898.1 nucleotide-binding universal stress UspA family protein [Arthrobacter sp. PvP103]MBP1239032.1 nucleotide-binding universal stress UspA family protein [Arthrobacter sp. PvP102]